MSKTEDVPCPMCDRSFPPSVIQQHADRCLFLNSSTSPSSSVTKKIKLDHHLVPEFETRKNTKVQQSQVLAFVFNFFSQNIYVLRV